MPLRSLRRSRTRSLVSRIGALYAWRSWTSWASCCCATVADLCLQDHLADRDLHALHDLLGNAYLMRGFASWGSRSALLALGATVWPSMPALAGGQARHVQDLRNPIGIGRVDGRPRATPRRRASAGSSMSPGRGWRWACRRRRRRAGRRAGGSAAARGDVDPADVRILALDEELARRPGAVDRLDLVLHRLAEQADQEPGEVARVAAAEDFLALLADARPRG